MSTDTLDAAEAPTLDQRIAARLADLTAQLDALPAPDTVPLSWTSQQLLDLKQQRAVIEVRIAAIHTAASTVAALGSDDADRAWRDFLTVARSTLVDELLTFKSPIRDKALLGLASNLAASINAIDRGPKPVDRGGREIETLRLGELMRDAGYQQVGADPAVNYGGRLPWYGSLPEVTARIDALASRRAKAEAALAVALLSDAEAADRTASDQARRDALNALFIKVGRDGHLVAYKSKRAFVDDEPYPVDEMTPIEREAFERMARAHGAAR